MSVRMGCCPSGVTAGVAVGSMVEAGSGGGHNSLGWPLVLDCIPGVVEHGQRTRYLAAELLSAVKAKIVEAH